MGEVHRRCKAPFKMGRGRVVIDGGFTKLYDDFWNRTAGTERYVKNASAWLLNMNSRIVSQEVDGFANRAPDLQTQMSQGPRIIKPSGNYRSGPQAYAPSSNR